MSDLLTELFLQHIGADESHSTDCKAQELQLAMVSDLTPAIATKRATAMLHIYNDLTCRDEKCHLQCVD